MQVDSTGTRLAPRQFNSAIEVAENAKRVRAFRHKSWVRTPYSHTAPLAPVLMPAPQPMSEPYGAPAIVDAMATAFSITSDDLYQSVGFCPASAAREYAAAVYCRFGWRTQRKVCQDFGISGRVLVQSLKILDRILFEHRISFRSPLHIVCDFIHATHVEIQSRGARYSLADIQAAVCERFEQSREDLISARRTAAVLFPRQVAMALCKKLTLRSLPEIGRAFGGRDHSTIHHSIKKLEPAVIAASADIDPKSDIAIWVDAVTRHAMLRGLHMQKNQHTT